MQSILQNLLSTPMIRISSIDDIHLVKLSPDYSDIDLDILEKVAGYKLLEEFFVDSSGLGGPGEPAISLETLINEIKIIMENGNTEIYSCLTGIGQFQVYVGIFIKKEEK